MNSYWGIERDGSTQIIKASPTGYVYVANWGSNNVSVISHTQRITDVVVGANPNAVGVDPLTGYVYVANVGSDSVSVIAGTSMITTVGVGDYPFELAVNPTTGYVYVANQDDDSVSILRYSPLLSINYTSGQPGSFFTLTGSNFPPSSTAEVAVNGVTLTDTMPVDPSGSFAFLLNTSQADLGSYFVTVTANISATIFFILDSDGPLRLQEGNGPILIVPNGIAWKLIYFPLIER